MRVNIALRIRREEKGISQNELHRRAEVPQRNISYWECGHGSPTIVDCLKLANGLGITLVELLQEVDEE